MKKVTLIIAALSITLVSSSVMALDVSDQSVKQTTLKHVMKGLLRDAQLISEGIYLQDFKSIEAAAQKIACHPTPSAEYKQKLAKNLGAEMGVFKTLDTQVHDSAVAIAKAANKKNMKLVVTEYHKLVDGCQSCHASFKKRVAEIMN